MFVVARLKRALILQYFIDEIDFPRFSFDSAQCSPAVIIYKDFVAMMKITILTMYKMIVASLYGSCLVLICCTVEVEHSFQFMNDFESEK